MATGAFDEDWEACDRDDLPRIIGVRDGRPIAMFYEEHLRDRAVECVNQLDGLDPEGLPELLEAGAEMLSTVDRPGTLTMIHVATQRLRKALKGMKP